MSATYSKFVVEAPFPHPHFLNIIFSPKERRIHLGPVTALTENNDAHQDPCYLYNL